jgi:hypothetical protein
VRPSSAIKAVENLTALERLRAENASLRASLGKVEAQLEILDPSTLAVGSLNPEDFWSPLADVPGDHEFIEEYGTPSPVPNHDGTECFKWDNTMESAREHFKVRKYWSWNPGLFRVTQPSPVMNHAVSLEQVQGHQACNRHERGRHGQVLPGYERSIGRHETS